MPPIPTAPIGGKVGGEFSSSYTASRGNQITVRFRNVAFSKKTTTKDGDVIIEGPTDPALLKNIMDALQNSGITPFIVNMDQLK